MSGFRKLAKAFDEGREVQWKELNAALAGLAESHAEAVKQRVNALNRTVRGRNRIRYTRKPDIRELFPDADSNGTRSRSATPDSLDYQQNHGDDGHMMSSGSVGTGLGGTLNLRKQHLQRTSSTPLRGAAELFRGSHIRCDIPFYTEGIELVAFHRLGTIHIPRVRASSDPNCSVRHRGDCQLNNRHGGCCQYQVDANNNTSNNNSQSLGSVMSSGSNSNSGSDIVSLSPVSSSPPNSPPRESPLMVASNSSSPAQRSSPEPISFENLCRQSNSILHESISEIGCDIDDLSESDYKKVQSLLWLELAALFDKHRVSFDKRKPLKRKKKEEGNLFGVSLNALVRRDQQVTGEETSLVPLILQGLLKELTDRGITEKGILRVAGHKQKVS